MHQSLTVLVLPLEIPRPHAIVLFPDYKYTWKHTFVCHLHQKRAIVHKIETNYEGDLIEKFWHIIIISFTVIKENSCKLSLGSALDSGSTSVKSYRWYFSTVWNSLKQGVTHKETWHCSHWYDMTHTWSFSSSGDAGFTYIYWSLLSSNPNFLQDNEDKDAPQN